MILDRSLIPLIAGPLAGLLVMSGFVTPTCSDEVAKLAIGGGIFVSSLLIGAVHHVELDRNKQTAQPANNSLPVAVTSLP